MKRVSATGDKIEKRVLRQSRDCTRTSTPEEDENVAYRLFTRRVFVVGGTFTRRDVVQWPSGPPRKIRYCCVRRERKVNFAVKKSVENRWCIPWKIFQILSRRYRHISFIVSLSAKKRKNVVYLWNYYYGDSIFKLGYVNFNLPCDEQSHTHLCVNWRRSSTGLLWPAFCGSIVIIILSYLHRGEAQNTQDHFRKVIGLCSRRIIRHFFPGTSELLMSERIAREAKRTKNHSS